MTNFTEFMKCNICSRASDYTHTSFKGEKYYIQTEDYDTYLKLYNEDNGCKYGMVEYPSNIRYMRFDLDLHFNNNRHYKQYTKDHIYEIVKSIRNEISYYHQDDKDFTIYVLQRPEECEKGSIIKHGLHIQIPDVTTDFDIITRFIRNKLISNQNIVKLLKDMNVINPINDVFDECIYEKNGWMQYNSDKGRDNSNSYQVKYYQLDDKYNHVSSLITPTKNQDINYTELFSLRNKKKVVPLNVEGQKIFDELFEEQQQKEREQIANDKKKKDILELVKASRKYDDVVDKDFIKELVGILHADRVEDYKKWTELGWCLKSIDDNLYELFDKLSKNSKKYDENAVDKFWNNSTQGNYSLGTLRYWAKNDNPENYNLICDKYRKWDMKNTLPKWDDDSIAKDFSKRHFTKFIFQDEVMYYFNGVYWEIDEKNRNLKNFIANEYYDELTEINYKKWTDDLKKPGCDKDVCDGFKDNYNKCIATLKKNSNRKNLSECIEGYIMNNDIKFDTKPYLFVFKNKVWDLTKSQFIKPNPLDYMTMTCGYKYEEDSNLEAKMELINTVITQILPNTEVKECLLKILASGMSGIRLPKITILNGCGRNGKGVLMKLLQSAIGTYFVKIDNSILTEKKGKSGSANPAKAKLDKARVASFVEPDDTERLNCSSLKEITGESTLDGARALYSQKDSIDLFCTLLIECNKKPLLNETTQAIIQRIMDILFPNTFTDDKDAVDEENGYFPINLNYDTPEWRETNRIAMFHYLQPYFMKLYNDDYNLNTPQCIKERNEKYLADSDDIYSWFKSLLDEDCEGYQYIKQTENKSDYIKIADLYNMFKQSTYFTNLSKKEKRELNKSKFIEKIVLIKQFRKVYKEKQQKKVAGKNETVRNILTNYTLCSKNTIDEDEDL